MSLDALGAIKALSSMNFTSNCSISISWLQARGSPPVANSENSVEIAFLREILPQDFSSLSDQSLLTFYDQLAAAKPSLWYDAAIETIQTKCLAPQLANSLSFRDLDLSKNCLSTASYYSNALCAIDGSGWSVNSAGKLRWLVGSPPASPINGTSGLLMLRKGLPLAYENISDAELAAWSTIPSVGAESFMHSIEAGRVCQVCLPDFCAAANFTGNPDIAGIGAFASYLIGASLITISFLVWLLCKFSDWHSGTENANSNGIFRISANNTLRALSGGTVALSLSLSVALLVLLARRNLSSSYEQIMAENATYISFYMLIILGSYFPLSTFEGTEFATTWMVLYYCFIWMQSLGLAAVIIDGINSSWHFGFGDLPCLQYQLGDSVINNPLIYSLMFAIFGGLPRILLIFSFTFKALQKWFDIRDATRAAAANPGRQRHKSVLWITTTASNAEAISIIMALPFFLAGLVTYGGWVCLYYLYFHFTSARENSWNWADSGRRMYANMPTLLTTWFEWTSYGAWVLSILSLPLMWLNVAFIIRVRHAMSEIAGSSWLENQVGFGQVLALLIWAPVMLGFTLTLAQLLIKKLLSLLAEITQRINPPTPPAADNEP